MLLLIFFNEIMYFAIILNYKKLHSQQRTKKGLFKKFKIFFFKYFILKSLETSNIKVNLHNNFIAQDSGFKWQIQKVKVINNRWHEDVEHWILMGYSAIHLC